MKKNTNVSDDNANSSGIHNSLLFKKFKRPSKSTILLGSLLVLVILAGASLYIWQQHKVVNLNKQVKGLQYQINSYQNSATTSQPDYSNGPSLTQVISEGQQPKNESLTIDNGDITVNSAAYINTIDGTSVDTNGSDETIIASITLDNTTSSLQTYDFNYLSVQMPDGEVVNYSDIYNADQNTGSTITLAASSSVSKDVVFAPISSGDKAGKGYLLYTPPSPTDSNGNPINTNPQPQSQTAITLGNPIN
jgi:hypothetical protein